jgi:hypothetical protein
VTITSTGPGSATLSAVYDTVIGNLPVSIPAVDDAEKTWRTFRVRVTPASAQNVLGQPHTFTVTVERSDDGTTWAPVRGAIPTATVTAPGTITSNGCAGGTNSAGRCTVVVSSPDTGAVTLTARYAANIGGATANFTSTARKTWIDYSVAVTPATAENLVSTNHVLVVTVLVDRGNGFVPLAGARPSLSLGGVGAISSETCSTGTGADGTCRVTITSNAAGTTTVIASYAGGAGGETVNFTDRAAKDWIDYRVAIDPRSATNRIGDPHTFIVTLQIDRGSGFVAAPGETLTIRANGTGSITRIDAAGPSAGTCRTDSAGSCRVTVSSSGAGTLTITASFEASAGETSRIMTSDAQKSWIGGGIPATGNDALPLIRIAAIAITVGLLLVLGTMRRRAATAR